MKRILTVVCSVLIAALVLSACQSDSEEQQELVIYSGRSKALVDSLVERYRQQADVPVRVRYGTDAQLLAALEEEGDQSQADVFWANTTGALGAASNSNLLAELSDSLAQIPANYAPSSRLWTPVTTRFRVLAYNSDRVNPDDLPESILNLPEQSELDGRVGWTPAYSSFQDFVTALRETEGEEAARAWLNGMQELNPKSYSSNTPMIQALAAGEIDVALTNHYYVLRLTEGESEGEEEEATSRASAPVDTYHFASGDVGNLALVTGAAQLGSSDQPGDAQDFLGFLLSEEAQAYAARTVNEYPVVQGVQVPDYMLPVNEALELSPTFDFERLRNLEATLQMLRDTGIL